MRATGHTDSFRFAAFIDYPMLSAIAVWGALFVVVLSSAMDIALSRLDPRVRAAR